MTTIPSSPKLAEPSIESCITALVSALQHSKGWLHDYADGVVRDAIDRRHLEGEPAKPLDQWKCGNEFLPYHHQASHVNPDHRDGWNACYSAAQASIQALEAEVAGLKLQLEAGPLYSTRLKAKRYDLLRRGQHWSVIDGIGNTLRAEALDAAIDAARAAQEVRG